MIVGYSALLDPHQLGLKLQAFVEITLTSQSKNSMERFEQAVLHYFGRFVLIGLFLGFPCGDSGDS